MHVPTFYVAHTDSRSSNIITVFIHSHAKQKFCAIAPAFFKLEVC